MPYQHEMQFLQKAFARCNLQMLLLDPFAPPDQRIDLGLRKTLGLEERYEKTFYQAFRGAGSNTIYRLTDPFFCSYLFFLLPDRGKPEVAVLGPYLSVELTREQLLENAEIYGIPPKGVQQIEKYFSGVPFLAADSPLFTLLDTFAEHIWGGSGAFSMVDVNQEPLPEPIPVLDWELQPLLEENAGSMLAMESRYARENELMQAVSRGQAHRAELLMSGFSHLSFERRMADPVRNHKNYCIIMNTLLRKAAESGGVHPLYLDRLSSAFARKIETLSSTDAVKRLMEQMCRDYCRLVKKYATRHYSPPVQETILYINTNLSADLSLKALSSAQNINASYLSALFKKETGQTVTDYVSQKRVQLAARLLHTTTLQIQTIAQHCGIPDVNYFSKTFKKYMKQTPKEYRQENQLAPRK